MKFYNYVVIFIGIMILFNAVGYSLPTRGLVQTLVMNNSADCSIPPCTKLDNLQSSSIWVQLLAVLGIASGVGVIAGIYFRTPDPKYLTAGFVSLFLSFFMVDLVYLYSKIIEHGDYWMVTLVTMIMAPLMVGLIITGIEWWNGSD